MKFKRNISAGLLMLGSTEIFNPKKEYYGKRVAIVGAAESAFQQRNGSFIDEFDIVVRINKGALVWSKEKAPFIGSKFTYLYHSFYENEFSGGGHINWQYFDELGIQKVINPNFTGKGLQAHFNYFKRNFHNRRTYVLKRKSYKELSTDFKNFIPTVGFSALCSVLQAQCEEVFITGFTFFKTPYADGYRPGLENMEDNKEHLKTQGLHNPDLEFKKFKEVFYQSPSKKIVVDRALSLLMETETL
ncbi:glycosyltransferase family 29 protein [Salegentibacter sp. F188]|uniref:Glycosyltransferase family 29 protein n=1 Tax=Autumnicola patrickiae TaxID=3075591 RepID=A0ABU3E1K9_9FLAO|nr:glycosyltransferase family 29 protein [Salegentibacter sp. F188]MDT0689835.1 glycosyltransferase family 29 protein [Salegentibacter sp. F188]